MEGIRETWWAYILVLCTLIVILHSILHVASNYISDGSSGSGGLYSKILESTWEKCY
jgi:hypothetical protein